MVHCFYSFIEYKIVCIIFIRDYITSFNTAILLKVKYVARDILSHENCPLFSLIMQHLILKVMHSYLVLHISMTVIRFFCSCSHKMVAARTQELNSLCQPQNVLHSFPKVMNQSLMIR